MTEQKTKTEKPEAVKKSSGNKYKNVSNVIQRVGGGTYVKPGETIETSIAEDKRFKRAIELGFFAKA